MSCYKTTTSPEETIATVIDTATKQGWTEDVNRSRPGSAAATKTVKYGLFRQAKLTLSVAAGKNTWCHTTHDANLRISISNS